MFDTCEIALRSTNPRRATNTSSPLLGPKGERRLSPSNPHERTETLLTLSLISSFHMHSRQPGIPVRADTFYPGKPSFLKSGHMKKKNHKTSTWSYATISAIGNTSGIYKSGNRTQTSSAKAALTIPIGVTVCLSSDYASLPSCDSLPGTVLQNGDL